MIDIHSHILPGIDDGAQTLEESVQMAERAVSAGIHTIIATPHHLNGFENRAQEIIDAASSLQQALAERNIPLQILTGQEVRVTKRTAEEMMEGHLLPLAGSRYMLIEFPASRIPSNVFELMHEMKLKHYVPILAHPERNREIAARPEWLHEFIEAGGFVQITAQSLTINRKLRNRCMALFRQQSVHFIASDAHDSVKRPPDLTEAYRIITEHVGAAYADYVQQNAERLRNNEPISPPPSLNEKRKWKLFSQLF